MKKSAVLQWNVSQGISYLLYPLLGWLADVYISRYKMIEFSFLFVLTGSLLMLTGSVERMFERNFSSDLNLLKSTLSILTLLVSIGGIGVYEANAIQFGMQQLFEASSEELSSFIYWYYWSFQLGPVLAYYISVLNFFYFMNCRFTIRPNKNISILGWVVFFPSLS